MRENGFDYPLHPLQCLTWALFPVILLDFYWLLLPLLPGEATRWAVGTVYTAAAATTFFCAWITAAVDPSDPKRRRKARGARLLIASPGVASRWRCGRRRSARTRAAATSARSTCSRRRSTAGSATSACFARPSLQVAEYARVGAAGAPSYICPGGAPGRVGAPRRRPGNQVRRCQELRLLPRGDRVDVRLHDDAARALRLRGRRAGGARPPALGRRRPRAPARRRPRVASTVLALVCAYAALLVPLVVLIGQLALFHAMLVGEASTTYEYILGEQRVDGARRRPPGPFVAVRPADPARHAGGFSDLVVVERGRGDDCRAAPARRAVPVPTSGDIGAAGGVSSTAGHINK